MDQLLPTVNSAQTTLERIQSLRARIVRGEEVPHSERSPIMIGQEAAVTLGRLARGAAGVKISLTEV